MQTTGINKALIFSEAIKNELSIFFDTQLPSSPEKLYDSARYALSLGGKRTRPVLVLLGCDLFGGDIKKAMPAAIAVELFHNFTLIHDDIMDAAPLRRNSATVHKKWSSNVAILSGDTLLVKSYQQLNKLDVKNKTEIIELVNTTALQVCEGQQMDMDYETMPDISIADYMSMIEKKTAVLLAGSFKVGALIAQASAEDANNIYQFGKHLGLAFQIQDDLLDVYGDENKFGKQKGGDIISNKKTFLLLTALQLDNKNELSALMQDKNIEEKEKISAVVKIYDKLQIKKISENEMNNQYEKSIQFLKKVNAANEKKNELIAFADSLMKREV